MVVVEAQYNNFQINNKVIYQILLSYDCNMNL